MKKSYLIILLAAVILLTGFLFYWSSDESMDQKIDQAMELFDRGDLSGAKAVLIDILKEDTLTSENRSFAHVILGRVYFTQDDFVRAKDEFKKSLNDSLESLNRARVLYAIALVSLEKSEKEEAISYAADALAIFKRFGCADDIEMVESFLVELKATPEEM